MCKDPEAAVCSDCLRNSKEASVPRMVKVSKRTEANEIREEAAGFLRTLDCGKRGRSRQTIWQALPSSQAKDVSG